MDGGTADTAGDFPASSGGDTTLADSVASGSGEVAALGGEVAGDAPAGAADAALVTTDGASGIPDGGMAQAEAGAARDTAVTAADAPVVDVAADHPGSVPDGAGDAGMRVAGGGHGCDCAVSSHSQSGAGLFGLAVMAIVGLAYRHKRQRRPSRRGDGP
jgi:hypothetical protein